MKYIDPMGHHKSVNEDDKSRLEFYLTTKTRRAFEAKRPDNRTGWGIVVKRSGNGLAALNWKFDNRKKLPNIQIGKCKKKDFDDILQIQGYYIDRQGFENANKIGEAWMSGSTLISDTNS